MTAVGGNLCKPCEGTGDKLLEASDAKGKTYYKVIPCPECRGTGKR